MMSHQLSFVVPFFFTTLKITGPVQRDGGCDHLVMILFCFKEVVSQSLKFNHLDWFKTKISSVSPWSEQMAKG